MARMIHILHNYEPDREVTWASYAKGCSLLHHPDDKGSIPLMGFNCIHVCFYTVFALLMFPAGL